MKYNLPHTIKNCIGETLIFKQLIKEPDGDKLIVENYVDPRCGPPMHTHFQQEEVLTVINGRMGYEVQGEKIKYAEEGETIIFKRGVSHRFWNAGDEVLHCTGWVKPANSLVFFLSSVFEAQNKSGSAEPDKFDGAFLLTRYASEYSIDNIPGFVRKLILPVLYRIGKITGKYRHFKEAPAPLKSAM